MVRIVLHANKLRRTGLTLAEWSMVQTTLFTRKDPPDIKFGFIMFLHALPGISIARVASKGLRELLSDFFTCLYRLRRGYS